MTKFRVLFVDNYHYSSRIAAAYFDRYAPLGITATSAGVSPQPLDQDCISFFSEQGLPRPDDRCVSINDYHDHFDLAIAIGLMVWYASGQVVRGFEFSDDAEVLPRADKGRCNGFRGRTRPPVKIEDQAGF